MRKYFAQLQEHCVETPNCAFRRMASPCGARAWLGQTKRKREWRGNRNAEGRDGEVTQASLTANDRDCELARTSAKTYARNALDKHQMHNSAKSIPW